MPYNARHKQNQPNFGQNRSLIVKLFAVKQASTAGLAQR
jgi:hypothetical protein